jgi:hypothetical protein
MPNIEQKVLPNNSQSDSLVRIGTWFYRGERTEESEESAKRLDRADDSSLQGFLKTIRTLHGVLHLY